MKSNQITGIELIKRIESQGFRIIEYRIHDRDYEFLIKDGLAVKARIGLTDTVILSTLEFKDNDDKLIGGPERVILGDLERLLDRVFNTIKRESLSVMQKLYMRISNDKLDSFGFFE